jgi:hypothetical protein
VTLASCANLQSSHPDDVIQKMSWDSSVVIFSTFSDIHDAGPAPLLTLYDVNAIGKRGRVRLGLALADHMVPLPVFVRNVAPDSASDRAYIDWQALPAGRYAVRVSYHWGQCDLDGCLRCSLSGEPQFEFSVAPGQGAYLGEFHVEGRRLELRQRQERDVEYFRGHAKGAGDITVLPAVVTVKPIIDGDC